MSGAHQRVSWVRLKWPTLCTGSSLPQEAYSFKQGGSLQLRHILEKLTEGLPAGHALWSCAASPSLKGSLGNASLHLPQNTAECSFNNRGCIEFCKWTVMTGIGIGYSSNSMISFTIHSSPLNSAFGSICFSLWPASLRVAKRL